MLTKIGKRKTVNVEKALDIFSHSYVRTAGTKKTPEPRTITSIIKGTTYEIIYRPSSYMNASHNVYGLLVLELMKQKYYECKAACKDDFFDTYFTISAKEVKQMIPIEILEKVDKNTMGRQLPEAMEYVFNFPIKLTNKSIQPEQFVLTRLASDRDITGVGKGMKTVYTLKPSRFYNILLPTRFENIEPQKKGEFKKNIVPFYKRQTNFFLPLILPKRQAHLWDFIRDQYEMKSKPPTEMSFNMDDVFWKELLPGQVITPMLKTKYRKDIKEMELNPEFDGSIKLFNNDVLEVYFE